MTKYEIGNLLSNSIASFQKITEEQKKDKNFLIFCLQSGVDGRILKYANPFILFTSSPQYEDDISDWYENAELDNQFIGEALKLNEHCFFGLIDNDDVIIKINEGYDLFDIRDDENAWVNALQNPKFLRYHNDFAFDEFIGEAKGTPVEQAFNKTIAMVKSNLNTFASSIINDYFIFPKKEYIEEDYDINFDESYFLKVAKNQTEEPTLKEHAQCQDIYENTNLDDFEAIIKFVFSH